MEPVDEYSYYRLGSAMQALLEIPDKTTFGHIFFPLYEAGQIIEELLKSSLPHSSRSAIKDVQSRMAEIMKEARDAENKADFNKEIPGWRITTLKSAVKDFQTIFARESPTMPIFFLPQKGLARTDQLVTNAEMDFAPPVRDILAKCPRVIEEIQQAGKSLAVDLFTARVFHIMRAVEVLVLELLDKYSAKPTADSQRNLGNYVKLLKEKGADAELTRFLDEVVRVERNESIHPTKLFSEAEADMIYSIAKSAIIAIAAQFSKGAIEIPVAADADLEL